MGERDDELMDYLSNLVAELRAINETLKDISYEQRMTRQGRY